MSESVEGSVVTLAGHTLITKLLSAKATLKITRASVGDGHIPAGTTAEQLTELVNETKEAEVAGLSNPNGGESMISLQVSSTGADSGFYVKEIGIFAEDPDAGEILYSYTGIQEHPQWIRPEGADIGNLAIFDICVVVDKVEKVTAIISPSAMAPMLDVEQLRLGKADKVTTAVVGNIATFSADGGIVDSGDKPTDYALKSEIPTKTSQLTNNSNFVADASYVHTDNNYDAAAKAQVAKIAQLESGKATTATYTATLTIAGWIADTAPYVWQQSVNVAGILAADSPITGQLLQGTTADAIEAEREAMGCVTRITTAAGSITAFCVAEKPAAAIKIQMKAVR